ncbi:VOC family protein [Shimazuella sp. AN120528]|uniref:VOC family protein n=1 Tax=Shimazuella soli TaxID=1892854 RepID=UPI001F116EA4|nr:VOC family protein [Shimazuella soli]MCH5583817.1 VOC family protein [Shimazuella soli]
MKLHNIRLCVTKFHECFFFYRDTLGFKVLWGDEKDAYAEFDTGVSKVALFKRELMAETVGADDFPLDNRSPDAFALIFEVEKVEKTYRDLQAKGVVFVTEPTIRENWGLKTAHFRDPQGNLIEIYEELRN